MSDIHSEEHPNTDPTREAAWPFVPRNDRFHSEGEVGVADYYSRKPRRSTGTLVALAPHVLLLARCEGAPETARYFSERLGVTVTEKMIKTLKFKVSRGMLVVTRKELEEAALSHPITAARMIREPAICDPQHYRAAITPEEEPDGEAEVKKAAVKKAAAKKAAKKEAARAKKPADTKPTATPAPEPKTPAASRAVTPAAATNLPPSPPTRNSDKGLPPIVSDAEAEENNRLLEEAARLLRG